MIGASLFDHTVAVWGSQEVRGATFGEVGRTWSIVPGEAARQVSIQARRETRQDTGPGERVVGEYVGYGPVAMDVKEGDVIQVTAAPDAGLVGQLLRVDSAYKPRGHHTQLVLIHWDGALS